MYAWSVSFSLATPRHFVRFTDGHRAVNLVRVSLTTVLPVSLMFFPHSVIMYPSSLLSL